MPTPAPSNPSPPRPRGPVQSGPVQCSPVRSAPHFGIPPRPACRPAPPRFGTFCFWTVLLLFLAAFALLGVLADTRNSGQSLSSTFAGGHFILKFVLAIGAITAVIAGIASRHQSR
jgi:hypothetical protein